MDASLITSIIGFVGAAVPLLIVILQLIRERNTRQIGANDPFIIAKLIKRHPIEQKVWKRIRWRRRLNMVIPYLIYLILYTVLFLALVGNFSLLYNASFFTIFIILFIIDVILICLSLILMLFSIIKYSYILYIKNAIDARYF